MIAIVCHFGYGALQYEIHSLNRSNALPPSPGSGSICPCSYAIYRSYAAYSSSILAASAAAGSGLVTFFGGCGFCLSKAIPQRFMQMAHDGGAASAGNARQTITMAMANFNTYF